MTNEEIKRENVDVWDYPASDKFTNVWRFMKQSEFPRTVEEAIQRVKTSKEGFAFIGKNYLRNKKMSFRRFYRH
jgi:ionotropic glutamate receptor